MASNKDVIQTKHGTVESGGPDADALLTEANKFQRAAPSIGAPSNTATVSQETIEAVQKGAFGRDETYNGNNSGFVGYYLEEGAKYVIPQLTPLRNMTPRVKGPGIDIVNWRAVVDYFNGSGPTVAAGVVDQQGTPPSLNHQFVNQSNVAKMIGVKDLVTFEAEIYGQSFQGDVRATVAAKLIPALMKIEEVWLINSGQRLWAPPPVNNLSTATTGGTVAAATNWILVTAVNANGETLASNLGSVSGAASNGGAPSIVTTGSTSTVTFNINRVPNATSYNVYVGTGATQPANTAMWKQSATTQFGGANNLNDPSTGFGKGYFQVTATAAWATTGTAYSTVVAAGNTSILAKSVFSGNTNAPLTFDGVQSLVYLNQAAASTLEIGGEVPLVYQPASVAGTLALSDIDTVHLNMFLNSAADPEYLFVSAVDQKKLSYLIAQSNTGAHFVFPTTDAQVQASIVGGYRATTYVNQTTGSPVKIVMLPFLTQGTMIFGSFSIPYMVAEFMNPVFRVQYNRDMFALEYPPDQSHPTQWMYGAYLNETLVNQFFGGWAIVNGITIG